MSSRLSDRAKYWQKHVEAAKSFRGSAVEYCAREKIGLHSFYQWRRRLSSAKALAPDPIFAPVEVFPASSAQNFQRSCSLADPKWAAVFVSHLLREMNR
mgnify:CR=1 FL=1